MEDEFDDIPEVYYNIQPQTNNVGNRLDPGKLILTNTSMPTFEELMKQRMEAMKKSRSLPQRQKDKNYNPDYETKSILFVTGNCNNKWQQIEQITNQFEDGPYHMDGRDNKLTIHNSRAADKILFSYIYNDEDGELLEFEVKTEFTVSIVEASKKSDIDADEKTIETEVNQVIPNTSGMYKDGKLVIHDPWTMYGSGMQQDNTRVLSGQVLNNKITVNPEEVKKSSTPIKYSGKYDSKISAQDQIGKNHLITQSDIDSYYTQLEDWYKKIQDPSTNQELYTQLYNPNSLPDYIIKRRVTIETEEDPGKYQQSSPKGYKYETRGPTGQKYSSSTTKEKAWMDGYKHLEKKSGIRIIKKDPNDKLGGYRVGDKIVISKEVEVEIPIPGVRILAAESSHRSSQALVNDMVRSTQNKITSNARVIGNPALESSMNVEIKNVSERYSGVWYTKEVVHSFDDSGYFCEIDFIQKSLPIMVSTISGSIPTVKQWTSLNPLREEAKKSLESKAYLKNPALVKKFWELRKDLNYDGNFLIVTSECDPNQAEVFWADQDMEGYKGTSIGTIRVDNRDVTVDKYNSNYGIIPKDLEK